MYFLSCVDDVVKEHAKHVYNDATFRESLAKYGLAHVVGAISPELIRKTLFDVNKRLYTMDLKEFGYNDPGVGKYSFNTDLPFYHETFDHSLLPHLFHLLLGPMERPYKSDVAQVTIRFPGMFCGNDDHTKRWHLDGVGPQSNDNITAVKPRIQNFDALVVILLSDSHGKYSGELGVYPQSHLRLSKWLTPERLHQWQYTGLEALPNGPLSDEVVGTKPFHLLGKAGDIFITNYMIGHFPICNESPHLRYNLYYRVNGPTSSSRHSLKERPQHMYEPIKHWKL